MHNYDLPWEQDTDLVFICIVGIADSVKYFVYPYMSHTSDEVPATLVEMFTSGPDA